MLAILYACFERFMNDRAGNGKAYIPTECEHIANICTHGVNVSLVDTHICVALLTAYTAYAISLSNINSSHRCKA